MSRPSLEEAIRAELFFPESFSDDPVTRICGIVNARERELKLEIENLANQFDEIRMNALKEAMMIVMGASIKKRLQSYAEMSNRYTSVDDGRETLRECVKEIERLIK